MIATIVLIISFLLIFLVVFIVGRAIITKQTIIGRPPVPGFFFILAKSLVAVNLVFLLLKGFHSEIRGVFEPGEILDWIALVILITGSAIVFLSTIRLNKDLIFGLSSSMTHKLQTRGLFSFSRHPFYLGFLLILFSSCLLTPHILNILAFAGAWIIHHFIMIKEEDFLQTQYGDEYIEYKKNVRRYITF